MTGGFFLFHHLLHGSHPAIIQFTEVAGRVRMKML
ncbi:hypothetical protein QJS25_gp67 [Serratia phage vB_SmaS_Bonzee]|nr:hypothetical protein QJS25_gp67 [Serratia phage vB_SmaS_Bonzee]UKL15207.1 hypothetical protein BONZEE_67 [Serratia phage vB_SmaS_Bonzee]